MDETALVPVHMPQMGESLAEGTVVRWLKQPGDAVARDEPLFEISTDKVDTDVPSPTGGVLHRILVAEGETVGVGVPVALLDSGGAVEPAAAVEPETAPPGSTEPGVHFASAQPAQLVSFRSARDAPPDAVEAGGRPGGGPARDVSPRSYSPAVLAAAREGAVPLATLTTLPGSGRGGRLTKRDVADYLRTRGHPGPGGAVEFPDAPPAEYLYRPSTEDRRERMSVVRRATARHMRWSTRISPQATALSECDVSHAAALLDRASGVPLTYTVLAAQAAVRALAEAPRLNASVLGDELIVKPHVHLGIAVVLADTDELIVPVVRDADELSLEGMAHAIHDLATRARKRRLRPEEVQGGTFTLTNPGAIGGLGGTPILLQPQVAILGLGAVTKRAVVIDDAIAIRPMLPLSLTFDHRAVDGHAAFRYLEAVRRRLEGVGADLDAGKKGGAR